jgi:hypothetical protein
VNAAAAASVFHQIRILKNGCANLKTFFIKEICKKLHKQRISVHEVVVFSGAVFVILGVLFTIAM